MEQELEDRKSSMPHPFIQRLDPRKISDLNRPSDLHIEPYLTHFSVPLDPHIEIHKRGLKMIDSMRQPKEATNEDRWRKKNREVF
ncbi:hypothetical protein ES703_38485 [subsurface metagenome]